MVQRSIDTKDEFVSTAERLRREGKAEGTTNGRNQHAIETVLRLLGRRFGQVPAALVQRVQAAPIEQLDGWTDRILDAKSLDEVFAA